jgi:hypothetical protein
MLLGGWWTEWMIPIQKTAEYAVVFDSLKGFVEQTMVVLSVEAGLLNRGTKIRQSI